MGHLIAKASQTGHGWSLKIGGDVIRRCDESAVVRGLIARVLAISHLHRPMAARDRVYRRPSPEEVLRLLP